MTVKEKKLLTAILTWASLIIVIITIIITYNKKLSYYSQAITHKTEQISHLKRQIANKPALINAIEEINNLIDQSKLFILAPDKQTSDAMLLSQTKKIIEEAGGEIQTITPMNNRRNKKNNSRVNISMEASQEAFVEIIKNMGAAKPLMNITQARLVPIWDGRGQRRTETGKVRVHIQVEAFYALGVAQ